MSWIKINGRRFNFCLIRDYMLKEHNGTHFVNLVDHRGKDEPIRCDSKEDAETIARRLDNVLMISHIKTPK